MSSSCFASPAPVARAGRCNAAHQLRSSASCQQSLAQCRPALRAQPADAGRLRWRLVARPVSFAASGRPAAGPSPPGRASPLDVRCDAALFEDEEISTSSVGDLIDWLVDNGLPTEQLDVVSIAFFREAGRGLLSKRKIKREEMIVDVPAKLLMNEETARASVIGGPLEGVELDEFVVIALHLLHERSLGADSFWAPYIRALPDFVDAAVFWEESRLERLLKGSPVILAARRLRAQVEGAFASLEREIFAQHRDIFPADVFNLTEFKWAFSMILSRAVFMPSTGKVAMVPLADLANHTDTCTSFIDFDKQAKAVRVYADIGYEEGEQVFACYGQKSNAELLLGYGFAIEDNEHDCMDITVQLDESDSAYAAKAAVLEKAGMKPVMTFPLADGKFAQEMFAFLRLAALRNDEEARRLGPGIFEDVSRPVSNANERTMCRSFVSLVDSLLAAYPNPLQETLSKMGEKGPASSYAASLRKGEKKILKVCRKEALLPEIARKACLIPLFAGDMDLGGVKQEPRPGADAYAYENHATENGDAARAPAAASSSSVHTRTGAISLEAGTSRASDGAAGPPGFNPRFVKPYSRDAIDHAPEERARAGEDDDPESSDSAAGDVKAESARGGSLELEEGEGPGRGEYSEAQGSQELAGSQELGAGGSQEVYWDAGLETQALEPAPSQEAFSADAPGVEMAKRFLPVEEFYAFGPLQVVVMVDHDNEQSFVGMLRKFAGQKERFFAGVYVLVFHGQDVPTKRAVKGAEAHELRPFLRCVEALTTAKNAADSALAFISGFLAATGLLDGSVEFVMVSGDKFYKETAHWLRWRGYPAAHLSGVELRVALQTFRADLEEERARVWRGELGAGEAPLGRRTLHLLLRDAVRNAASGHRVDELEKAYGRDRARARDPELTAILARVKERLTSEREPPPARKEGLTNLIQHVMTKREREIVSAGTVMDSLIKTCFIMVQNGDVTYRFQDQSARRRGKRARPDGTLEPAPKHPRAAPGSPGPADQPPTAVPASDPSRGEPAAAQAALVKGPPEEDALPVWLELNHAPAPDSLDIAFSQASDVEMLEAAPSASQESLPAGGGEEGAAAGLSRTQRRKWKTVLCREFAATGECPKGERCGYAHGEHELRKKGPKASSAPPPKQSGGGVVPVAVRQPRYVLADGTAAAPAPPGPGTPATAPRRGRRRRGGGAEGGRGRRRPAPRAGGGAAALNDLLLAVHDELRTRRPEVPVDVPPKLLEPWLTRLAGSLGLSLALPAAGGAGGALVPAGGPEAGRGAGGEAEQERAAVLLDEIVPKLGYRLVGPGQAGPAVLPDRTLPPPPLPFSPEEPTRHQLRLFLDASRDQRWTIAREGGEKAKGGERRTYLVHGVGPAAGRLALDVRVVRAEGDELWHPALALGGPAFFCTLHLCRQPDLETEVEGALLQQDGAPEGDRGPPAACFARGSHGEVVARFEVRVAAWPEPREPLHLLARLRLHGGREVAGALDGALLPVDSLVEMVRRGRGGASCKPEARSFLHAGPAQKSFLRRLWQHHRWRYEWARFADDVKELVHVASHGQRGYRRLLAATPEMFQWIESAFELLRHEPMREAAASEAEGPAHPPPAAVPWSAVARHIETLFPGYCGIWAGPGCLPLREIYAAGDAEVEGTDPAAACLGAEAWSRLTPNDVHFLRERAFRLDAAGAPQPLPDRPCGAPSCGHEACPRPGWPDLLDEERFRELYSWLFFARRTLALVSRTLGALARPVAPVPFLSRNAAEAALLARGELGAFCLRLSSLTWPDPHTAEPVVSVLTEEGPDGPGPRHVRPRPGLARLRSALDLDRHVQHVLLGPEDYETPGALQRVLDRWKCRAPLDPRSEALGTRLEGPHRPSAPADGPRPVPPPRPQPPSAPRPARPAAGRAGPAATSRYVSSSGSLLAEAIAPQAAAAAHLCAALSQGARGVKQELAIGAGRQGYHPYIVAAPPPQYHISPSPAYAPPSANPFLGPQQHPFGPPPLQYRHAPPPPPPGPFWPWNPQY
eukprot:tig00020554_g10878.t1